MTEFDAVGRAVLAALDAVPEIRDAFGLYLKVAPQDAQSPYLVVRLGQQQHRLAVGGDVSHTELRVQLIGVAGPDWAGQQLLASLMPVAVATVCALEGTSEGVVLEGGVRAGDESGFDVDAGRRLAYSHAFIRFYCYPEA